MRISGGECRWISTEYYAEDDTINITIGIKVPANLETESRNLEIGALKKVLSNPSITAISKMSTLLEFLLRDNLQDKKNSVYSRHAALERKIEIVSVHAPNLSVCCGYELLRKAIVQEWIACARVAEEMGASVFVCHLADNDYSVKAAHEMLDELDGCRITITMENGLDLQAYKAFVDRIGSDRFGMTVDLGHSRDKDGKNPFTKKERAREALVIFGQRLAHVHLHDFIDTDPYPPNDRYPHPPFDHYPPFDGYIQWQEVFAALRDINYAGTLMFEAGDRISLEDTLTKVAAFPREFAKRYPS